MSKSQLFSGARGKIIFRNGTTDHVLGVVTDVSVSTNASIIPTYVVGTINAITLEPTGYDCNCSLGRIVPVNTAAAKADKKAGDGSTMLDEAYAGITAIAMGMEPPIGSILTAPSIEIRIEDKITGDVIACVKEARWAGRSMSNGAGGIAQERMNFIGIYDAANGNVSEDMAYGLAAPAAPAKT